MGSIERSFRESHKHLSEEEQQAILDRHAQQWKTVCEAWAADEDEKTEKVEAKEPVPTHGSKTINNIAELIASFSQSIGLDGQQQDVDSTAHGIYVVYDLSCPLILGDTDNEINSNVRITLNKKSDIGECIFDVYVESVGLALFDSMSLLNENNQSVVVNAPDEIIQYVGMAKERLNWFIADVESDNSIKSIKSIKSDIYDFIDNAVKILDDWLTGNIKKEKAIAGLEELSFSSSDIECLLDVASKSLVNKNTLLWDDIELYIKNKKPELFSFKKIKSGVFTDNPIAKILESLKTKNSTRGHFNKASEDDLFRRADRTIQNMGVSWWKKSSGLPVNVWLDDEMTYVRGGYGKRIKFQRNTEDRPNTRTFSIMTISDNPKVIRKHELSDKEILQLKEFVVKNKDALEKLSDVEIGFLDFLEMIKR